MVGTVPRSQQRSDAQPADTGGWWWVYLVTGSLWILFGFAVLNGRDEITTVWTIAILAGFMFITLGVGEFVTAFVAEGWRWLHAVLGVIAILAGLGALAWPGQTFLTLASIIGWYLLFTGGVHMAQGFGMRGVDDSWWAGVVIGVGEILLAFWAVGYPGRSITLLVLWVALSALARGLLQLVAGFSRRPSGPRAALA
jgi:uncharacterized membrane protein HdeD (DUF308 family)